MDAWAASAALAIVGIATVAPMFMSLPDKYEKWAGVYVVAMAAPLMVRLFVAAVLG